MSEPDFQHGETEAQWGKQLTHSQSQKELKCVAKSCFLGLRTHVPLTEPPSPWNPPGQSSLAFPASCVQL